MANEQDWSGYWRLNCGLMVWVEKSPTGKWRSVHKFLANGVPVYLVWDLAGNSLRGKMFDLRNRIPKLKEPILEREPPLQELPSS